MGRLAALAVKLETHREMMANGVEENSTKLNITLDV